MRDFFNMLSELCSTVAVGAVFMLGYWFFCYAIGCVGLPEW